MILRAAARRRFLRGALALSACASFGQLARAFAQTESGAGARMAEGRPSITALGAAMLRAAHQLVDEPKILDDPLALRIIGAEGEKRLRSNLTAYARRRTLRAYVAMRSRYAEDMLELAVARGVRQYVVLGAGLDTFAYRDLRNDLRLRIFEVDHPATQVWKRALLHEGDIGIPDALTFAPVDFERQTLGAGLANAGFNAAAPAFFSMLGVAVYLTKPALFQTLRSIIALERGTEIVFSYGVPSAMLTDAQRSAREAGARRASDIGEPWLSYYEPESLAAELERLGFSTTLDFGPDEANARYFSNRADGLRLDGGERLMRARV
jgi:methyltransferase (TIGR00027 family)